MYTYDIRLLYEMIDTCFKKMCVSTTNCGIRWRECGEILKFHKGYSSCILPNLTWTIPSTWPQPFRQTCQKREVVALESYTKRWGSQQFHWNWIVKLSKSGFSIFTLLVNPTQLAKKAFPIWHRSTMNGGCSIAIFHDSPKVETFFLHRWCDNFETAQNGFPVKGWHSRAESKKF